MGDGLVFPQYAFYQSTTITSVTFMDEVASIGTATFYSVTNLQNVTFMKNRTAPTIGSSSF